MPETVSRIIAVSCFSLTQAEGYLVAKGTWWLALKTGERTFTSGLLFCTALKYAEKALASTCRRYVISFSFSIIFHFEFHLPSARCSAWTLYTLSMF